MANDTKRLAVLIDAENAQLSVIDNLMEEIANLGSATVKRIYGDFKESRAAKWNDKLLEHSIQPIHQLRNTRTKNASDIALVIDAMDLLHSGKIDGFCLVSSDSDFTGLARRIREDGLMVYGFGEEGKAAKTSFVPACDRFIYVENLKKRDGNGGAPKPKRISDPGLIRLLQNAVRDAADDSGEGWASLGQVGQLIYKLQPDFDPRNYDCGKLNELVEATGRFELQRRGREGGAQSLYVRSKRQAK